MARWKHWSSAYQAMMTLFSSEASAAHLDRTRAVSSAAVAELSGSDKFAGQGARVAEPPVARRGVSGLLRLAFGLLAGIIFIALLVREVDWSSVVALLGRATIGPLALGLAAFAADFVLRSVRFWMMLAEAAHRPLPLRPCIAPFIASFGISDILPLRAGDGFRVLWFHRRFGIPAGTIIGVMVVERLLDLVTILMLGGIAVMIAGRSAPPSLQSNFALISAVTLLGGSAVLMAPALLSRWLERVETRVTAAPLRALFDTLRATSTFALRAGSWRRLTWLTALSLACWILESLVFLGAWVSLGGSQGVVATPLLAFVSSTLGTLVPSLPGHFGSFEYFGLQAFALAGVDASFAAAVVLLAHLILWAPTAIFGVAWLLVRSVRPA